IVGPLVPSQIAGSLQPAFVRLNGSRGLEGLAGSPVSGGDAGRTGGAAGRTAGNGFPLRRVRRHQGTLSPAADPPMVIAYLATSHTSAIQVQISNPETATDHCSSRRIRSRTRSFSSCALP